jgi:hypothetical protein
MTDEPIEGTAEEMPETPAPQATASGDLVPVHHGDGAIIRAEQPDEIITKATTIADALKKLIDAQGLAASMGGNRKHVEVGAWQACGSMLGALGGQPLHAETVWTRVATDPGTGMAIRHAYTAEVKHYKWVNGSKQHASTTTYDVDGYDWEACVEIRTPDGTVVGRAEAMCSRAEEKWSKRDDYAVRSMAETRAESRAYRRAIGWIVHMAGYSPTPAEEMPTPQAELPAWAVVASPEQVAQLRKGLAYMLGDEPDGERVADVLKRLEGDTGPGMVPWIAGRAALHTAAVLKAVHDASAEPTADVPADSQDAEELHSRLDTEAATS